MPKKEWNWKKYYIPTFDELTIFCMSYTAIVLFFIDSELRDFLQLFLLEEFDLRAFIIFIMAVIGILFSIFHVISKRKKKSYEKIFMLGFVVFMNLIAGFVGIFSAFDNYNYLSNGNMPIIFPILNFSYGLYLFFLWRVRILDEHSVTDEDAPIIFTTISIFLLSIIIILCKYHFELTWPLTFSISISYVSIFYNFIDYTLKKISGLST